MHVLALLQSLAAFALRPPPDSRNRKLWNLFHWWFGRIILVAGLGNFFFGLWLVDSAKEWYLGAGAFIVFWCLIGLVKVGLLAANQFWDES